MKIERVDIHHVALPLVTPFETSFGREETIGHLILSVHAEGLVGWEECVADRQPWYTPETNGTATHILRDVLVPLLFRVDIDEPGDVVRCFQRVRGHPMARAALESAIWDWFGRVQGRSLAQMRGVQRERAPVGVSIGIEPTPAALVSRVAAYVDDGYSRVKLKIKPGYDVAVVRAVRERWPDLMLQVDANSAYTLNDIDVFHELDAFDLLLIEQPLHFDDIVDHARLQQQIATPICLDKSIHSPEHARWALDIGACRVINIKVGRVGGIIAAQQIHDLCASRGIPVWCGGMLESNVGRTVNLALAGLPNFTPLSDISASARYYQRDIATPNFTLNRDSTITIPHTVGIGVDIDHEYFERVRRQHIVVEKKDEI
jgi:O-succinylbenzoate synthase